MVSATTICNLTAAAAAANQSDGSGDGGGGGGGGGTAGGGVAGGPDDGGDDDDVDALSPLSMSCLGGYYARGGCKARTIFLVVEIVG